MSQSSSTLLRILLYLGAVIAIILFSLAIFFYLVKSRPQAPDKPVREKIWTVQTLPANPQSHRPEITLYGRIESPRSSELSAAVTAFVLQRHVNEGDPVTFEAPLLTLDPRDAKLLVEQKQADLADMDARIAAEKNRYQSDRQALQIQQQLLQLAARSVERFESLKGRNLGTDTQLDDAQRSYQQQALSLNSLQRDIDDHSNRLAQLKAKKQQVQVQLESALLDLDRTHIRAPFDGRIAQVNVAPGERVRGGDKLLTLYDTQSIEVRAQIPSRYLGRVRQSLTHNWPLTASMQLEGKSLTLTLNRISAQVGDGRAGLDGLFSVQENAGDLEPGRSVELRLTLPPMDNLLALPPQALYGTDRLYLVENERLKAVQIQRLGETLIDAEPAILVYSADIKAGDEIVYTQLPNAITGLHVQIAGK